MTGKRAHLHVIAGDAGIKSAKEIADGLRQSLTKNDRIEIDTQALTAADITTVQSLLAARNAAEAQGKSITMLSPLAPPLRQVLDAAGLMAPDQPHKSFWTDPPTLPKDATA